MKALLLTFTVTSEESTGTSGMKSTVRTFTTPAPGERIVAEPKP